MESFRALEASLAAVEPLACYDACTCFGSLSFERTRLINIGPGIFVQNVAWRKASIAHRTDVSARLALAVALVLCGIVQNNF